MPGAWETRASGEDFCLLGTQSRCVDGLASLQVVQSLCCNQSRASRVLAGCHGSGLPLGVSHSVHFHRWHTAHLVLKAWLRSVQRRCRSGALGVALGLGYVLAQGRRPQRLATVAGRTGHTCACSCCGESCQSSPTRGCSCTSVRDSGASDRRMVASLSSTDLQSVGRAGSVRALPGILFASRPATGILSLIIAHLRVFRAVS